MNAIDMLRGFAEAQARHRTYTEREVHRDDEVPVGEGWVRVEYDPRIKFAVWERVRTISAASVVISPGSEACADVRAYQKRRRK